jgi:hypothetical protein
MKTILYSSFIFLLLLIDTTLGAQNSQDKMVNEISQSNYSICYAKINKYDSIPFLEVDGLENNLISEELVFALDLDIDNSIIEIEEGVFIEFTFSLVPACINNLEYSELLMMPLISISKQMGIEFYGIVNR